MAHSSLFRRYLAAANLIFNLCLILKSCNSQRQTLTQPHLLPPINNAASQQQQQLNMINNNFNRQQFGQTPTTMATVQFNQMSTRPLERPNLSVASGPAGGSSMMNASQLQQNEIPESAADWLMLGADDLNQGEGKNVASFADAYGRNSTIRRSGHRRKSSSQAASSSSLSSAGGRNRTTIFDDEHMISESSDSESPEDNEGESSTLAGTIKEPECASQGRYYCTYKEEYPLSLVTEVTKYYKWPLEKLFRDLHAQIMPKLAQDSSGNLVCDSITRVVRPGWARNTNDRWLVVINTENYHQYVTEVVCQYGPNSRCNFIPPCYYSSCQQRYNTQKLLVIDPTNPYRGPFLSEFLFPSCCVCYVPSISDSFQDKYRSAPANIYQRTMQQEAASNLYPPQFKPTSILDELPASFIEQSSSARTSSQASSQTGGSVASAASASKVSSSAASAGGRVMGPGEIRRGGEQYKRHDSPSGAYHQTGRDD